MSSWVILLKPEFLQILKSGIGTLSTRQSSNFFARFSCQPMYSQTHHCLSALAVFLPAETNSFHAGENSPCNRHGWDWPCSPASVANAEHISWLLCTAKTCSKRRKAQISSIVTFSDPSIITSLQYSSIRAGVLKYSFSPWFNYVKLNWHLCTASKKAWCNKSAVLLQWARCQAAFARTRVEHSQAALLNISPSMWF